MEDSYGELIEEGWYDGHTVNDLEVGEKGWGIKNLTKE